MLYLVQFSLLSQSLPANVNILTLEPWDEGRFMIRFEHIYAVNEDEILSRPVTFSIDVSRQLIFKYFFKSSSDLKITIFFFFLLLLFLESVSQLQSTGR